MPTRHAPMSGKSTLVGTVSCNIFLHIQGMQTLLGLALNSLGESDLTGNQDYDLAVWISRVHAVFAAVPSLFYLTGIDFKTMAITLSRYRSFLPIIGYSKPDTPGIEVLIGKSLYLYIVPIFQLVYALIVADACMYCLHRLGHTNKWIYSKSRKLHGKVLSMLTSSRTHTLATS